MDNKTTLLEIREQFIVALKQDCDKKNIGLQSTIEKLIKEHLERCETEMELTTEKFNAVERRNLSMDELYNKRLVDLIGPDVESIHITIKRHQKKFENQAQYCELFDTLFEKDLNDFIKLTEFWKALEDAQKDPRLNYILKSVGFVIGAKVDVGCKAYKPFMRWILETFPEIVKERKYGSWGFKGMRLK